MIDTHFSTPAANPHLYAPVSSIAFDPPHHRVLVDQERLGEEIVEVPPEIPASYARIKPLFDRVITVCLMLAAIPVLMIVSALVLICDGRPIFYRQLRVGKNGKTFQILKFRTMRNNAEQQTGVVWSNPNDSRVTKLGRWLRCSHLDELPQLINVLAGEMSLVGPRPERPEFVETLSAEVPGYLQRTRVKPGITGLAQLCLGYDVCVTGIPEKLRYDLEYIRTASLTQDIRLLAWTLPYIAGQLYSNSSTVAAPQTLSRCPKIKFRSSMPQDTMVDEIGTLRSRIA